MRVVLQKVSQAAVNVDGTEVGSCGRGYLLLLGCIMGDSDLEADWLAEKICKLRLFESEDGTINDRSILETDGEVLVVSQFTLAGRTEKGNRPDYTAALPPEEAKRLYEHFVEALRQRGVRRVETGTFGAMMQVMLVNDGPVTLWLEK
jgi:D-tyrosyl-tRNA(Tyr) deacylase